ncbi:MAG TPA: transcription antitermination factor NusB [Bacillota bacterium]|nr:transcription antitermination factor NusB [Bacillota bacterium]
MARRQARETALKTMYQIDLGKVAVETAYANVLNEYPLEDEDREFARDLVTGTCSHLAEIDAIIRRVAVDWQLDRIAKVDRSILRLALYEIVYRKDVPDAVAVNEAVELAKLYSTDDSGKFVNGILGKVVAQPQGFRQDDDRAPDQPQPNQ